MIDNDWYGGTHHDLTPEKVSKEYARLPWN